LDSAFLESTASFSSWGVNLLVVCRHTYGFTSGISNALWTYYGIQWAIVAVGLITASVQRSLATSESLDEAAAE